MTKEMRKSIEELIALYDKAGLKRWADELRARLANG